MTTGNKDLISYAVAAIGTFVGLFALQALISTSQDIGWHADQQAAPMNPTVQAARAEERAALGAIDQAKAKVAAGERAAPVQPSTDVNALSGWVRGKHFAPAEPFKETVVAPTPAPEAAAPTGEAPTGAAAPAAPAAPAPAAAAPAPAPAAPAAAPAAAPTHH